MPIASVVDVSQIRYPQRTQLREIVLALIVLFTLYFAVQFIQDKIPVSDLNI